MLNRSAVVIGHEAAFYGWLKTSGITDEAIQERKEIAERAVSKRWFSWAGWDWGRHASQ
jgi:hypothetical protein